MFTSGWAGNAMPRELSGVQFNSKRKVGMGRGTSLSFLSSPHQVGQGSFLVPTWSSEVHKLLLFMCAQNMS